MTTITTWFTLGLLGELLGTALLAYGYTLVPEATRKRYLLLVSIPGIAVFAYILLVLDIGAVDGGGHTVYAVRYVDWLLTTPINVLYLGLLAHATRADIGKLVGLQTLTIVFGFAGALASGTVAYALFALGAVAFAGVVYLLYGTIADAAVASLSDVEASLYRTLRNFVVVLWSVYPVVWLLGGAGIGLMDVETASLVIVYLDVVTKVGFGFIALHAWMTMDAITTVDGTTTFTAD